MDDKKYMPGQRCSVCFEVVFDLEPTEEVHRIKVVNRPNYGTVVGSYQFCKDHLVEAEEAEKNHTYRGKKVEQDGA